MKRDGPATLPSSTATSSRPDTATTFVRLRVPEPARPPRQPASTPSSGAIPDVKSSGGEVDTEGMLPPAPATTVPRSMARGDLWGELPPELILLVASRLRFSRKDVEMMRAVCSAWREAVPSTMDPLLALSRRNPKVNSGVILMKIKRSGTCFETNLPFFPPPLGLSCWGSALGLMALQCHSPDTREVLVYCICCGESKELLPLPIDKTPRALYLEPLTPQRFVLMASEQNDDGTLYVDSYGFPWPKEEEGGPWWLDAPGFGKIPLRTMALDPGVVRAAADRDSIIIIDESGRPLDDPAQIMSIQLPPLVLSDGSSASPWKVNGQHLFLCCGKMYLLQIFDCPQAPERVAVRLLVVEKIEEEYKVTPVLDIGKYSVYLGPNQSFVLPSLDRLAGRLSNTVYVEDYRGSCRRPQALGINIETMATLEIPFPEEVKSEIKDTDTLPAVWVGLPRQRDVFNHCRDDKWRFWD